MSFGRRDRRCVGPDTVAGLLSDLDRLIEVLETAKAEPQRKIRSSRM